MNKGNVNANMEALAGTQVLDSDTMTIVLVHSDNDGNIDYAYSATLGNGESITFSNVFNGSYDINYTTNSFRTIKCTACTFQNFYAFNPSFDKAKKVQK